MKRKVTRLYTGTDGESHFEDIEIPVENKHESGLLSSETIKATGMVFQEVREYNNMWHHAPHRQFVVILEGGIEVELGDGTKRHFGPGDVLLAEDKTGRGHISRNYGKLPRRSITVTLD